MQNLSVTDDFIRVVIIFGSILITPLLMILGIFLFPVLTYFLIYSWCKERLEKEFEDLEGE